MAVKSYKNKWVPVRKLDRKDMELIKNLYNEVDNKFSFIKQVANPGKINSGSALKNLSKINNFAIQNFSGYNQRSIRTGFEK